MNNVVEVLQDHAGKTFWEANLRKFSTAANHLTEGPQAARQHNEIMTMARNTKHTPVNKRNSTAHLFSTDTSKVPQSVTIVHRPLEKQTKKADYLSTHPSFVKFSEHKRDKMQHISDHYSSATSKLF